MRVLTVLGSSEHSGFHEAHWQVPYRCDRTASSGARSTRNLADDQRLAAVTCSERPFSLNGRQLL